MFNLTLFIAYGLTFAFYSYSVYKYEDFSKLGLAASVTTLICDLYLILLYKAEIVKRLWQLTIVAISSRILIFAGGKDF